MEASQLTPLLEEAERENVQPFIRGMVACRGDALCNFIQLGPCLPLHLNGVSVHCWDCYNVRILSRGETVPTCENGGHNPTGEEAE